MKNLLNSPINRTVALATVLMFVMGTSSQAALLSYEGFSDTYATGTVNGQLIQGSGYAGAWTGNNTFVTGGLTYTNLLTTDGVHLRRDNGETHANMDLSGGGPFAAAGLIGNNGNIGGGDNDGVVYYSFLGRIDASGGNFTGFNLYADGNEGFGVGNLNNNRYSAFHSNPQGGPIGTPDTIIDGETHLFVIKSDFNANQDLTNFTVWLDPDVLLSEGDQNASISSTFTNQGGDGTRGFDQIRLRGVRGVDFDEFRFGTTFADVTPVISLIPEPVSASLLAIGMFSLIGRRRHRVA